MEKRVTWIDNAKAIGIISVVLGHMAFPKDIVTALYAFHIPLFFFLSGLTFRTNLPFDAFLKKKFRTIMVPYFFMAVVTLLFWLLRSRFDHGIAPFDPIHLVLGIFYGTATNGYLDFNVPLWFLPCLFVTELLLYAVCRLPGRWPAIAVALCVVCGFLLNYAEYFEYIPFHLPWGADIALVVLGFMALGYSIKGWVGMDRPAFVPGLWAVLGLPTCVALGLWHGRIDIATACFTSNLNLPYAAGAALFIAAACLGIAAVLGLSKLFPKNPVLDFLGRNSLIIFGFHFSVAACIKAVLFMGLHVPPAAFGDAIGLNLALTAAILLGTVLLALLLRRFLPWAVGTSSCKAGK